MDEHKAIRIGFLPLTDALPLIVAHELGFFAQQGLSVTLERMNSWAQVRDMLALGEIEAAHLLAPMVPASWLDGAYADKPFVTALSLNLNGNAITVSNALYRELFEADPDAMLERPVTARAMRKLIANRIKSGQEPPTIGAVFPYSSHNYAVRYWLGAEGINPDRDVRMVMAPPPMMVEQLEQGHIDAFCVGEPWNSYAERRGSGRSIVLMKEIWQHFPEKVLGVRASWAATHTDEHLALLRAVLQALIWLDNAKHRHQAAYILAQPEYVGLSPTVFMPALLGQAAVQGRKSLLQDDDALVFHHYAANFPWQSHALWFLTQMVRWGQVAAPQDLGAVAEKGYRPELYRQAAAALGLATPLVDHKTEGGNARAWILHEATAPIAMPRSRFMDDGLFDPRTPARYMESFLRHNMRVAPEEVGKPKK